MYFLKYLIRCLYFEKILMKEMESYLKDSIIFFEVLNKNSNSSLVLLYDNSKFKGLYHEVIPK